MKPKYGDLEIYENMAFQKRSWTLERASWFLMALIVLVSLLGLTGQGPFSHTRVGHPSRLQIAFERFPHANALTRLEVRLVTGGPYSLEFPFAYLRRTEVVRVVPQPDRVESRHGTVTYRFSGARGSATVLVNLEFRQAGPAPGFVRSADAQVDFTQYVYP